MPIYTHMSDKPFTLDKEFKYGEGRRRDNHFKPFGLWFEVNGDWRRWCEANDFRPENLKITHVVEFDHQRVLFLKTAGDILNFTRKYGVPDLVCGSRITETMFVDWPKVAEEYAGIVIYPYCWSLRLDVMWYYSWDCASGCIWDLSIITRFEPIELPVTLPEKENA